MNNTEIEIYEPIHDMFLYIIFFLDVMFKIISILIVCC